MSLAFRLEAFVRSLGLRRKGLYRHMRVFSHTSAEERLALHELARGLPEQARALEIGSHIGSSALFLGAALKPKGGSLLCVDTWRNETMPDGEQDTYPIFAANTADYADIITPLRKRSETLTPSDVGDGLDLAFIDGDHSEDAVRRDLAVVEPFMKPASILAFHDVSSVFPGVNVVVGEALASGRWQLAGQVGCLAWLRRAEGGWG